VTDAGARRLFGSIDLVYGLVLGGIVGWALPERHVVVDALGGLAAVACLGAGIALWLAVPWAALAARIAAAVLLALGLVLIGGIVTSVGFLHGIYGAIGELGETVLVVLAGLVVPYLVIFPLLQLARFGRRTGAAAGSGA
jgi:hypothetical protein